MTLFTNTTVAAAEPLTEDRFLLNTFAIGRGIGIGDPRKFFLGMLHASKRFKYRRKRERQKLFARVDALVDQTPPLTEDEVAGRMRITPDVIMLPLDVAESWLQL